MEITFTQNVNQFDVSFTSQPIIFETTFSNLGQQGFSAYEIAVQNGFVGTQAEWLESFGSTIILANLTELP